MIANSRRRSIRPTGLLALGLGVTLSATGCFFNQSTPAPSPSPSPTTAAQASPPAAAGSPLPTLPIIAASPTVTVYWPQQIEIPSIQVKAPVVQVGLEPDGAMEAPKGPDIIGWYTGSVAPGIKGNALVTAHVDWLDRSSGQSQEAVFWDLNKLAKGDKIIVHAEDNKNYTYAVQESVLVAFDDPDALEYLQPTDKPILTLITCEGDFDASSRNYDKRRIVVAEQQ